MMLHRDARSPPLLHHVAEEEERGAAWSVSTLDGRERRKVRLCQPAPVAAATIHHMRLPDPPPAPLLLPPAAPAAPATAEDDAAAASRTGVAGSHGESCAMRDSMRVSPVMVLVDAMRISRGAPLLRDSAATKRSAEISVKVTPPRKSTSTTAGRPAAAASNAACSAGTWGHRTGGRPG